MKYLQRSMIVSVAGISVLIWLSGDADGKGHSRRFCAYGSAVALSIGAGGAEWEQIWGTPAPGFFSCDHRGRSSFLNHDVTGVQSTQTTGAPIIDPALRLFLPFEGSLVLTAIERDENNGGCEGDDVDDVGGEIVATMAGEFVADLNAVNAVVTPTTISIAFGTPLHGGPDALVEVIQTNGKFRSIQAVGPWEWRVSGTVTIARDPSLDVQTNIFAALVVPGLILGAEEQVVLSGSYVRGRHRTH